MDEPHIEPTLEEQLYEWKRLLDTPAWGWLMNIAAKQIANRKESVFTQMVPGEEFEREYLKGEGQGILTMCELPKAIVEQLEVDVAALTKESENGTAA